MTDVDAFHAAVIHRCHTVFPKGTSGIDLPVLRRHVTPRTGMPAYRKMTALLLMFSWLFATVHVLVEHAPDERHYDAHHEHHGDDDHDSNHPKIPKAITTILQEWPRLKTAPR